MSERWPGGIVRSTPVTPTGPLQNGTAPGIWTMEQAAYWQRQGLWPTAGNFLAVEDVFSTYLYTGNGSTQTITNGIDLAGKGGMVWIKDRSAASSQRLYDTTRGANNAVFSNLTNAQTTVADSLTAFNSNGFTAGSANGTNGNNYASWTFREAPKFFDIVTYTGNGSTQNIAHNLGVAPGVIIVKSTTNTYSWGVYHRSYPNGYLFLNSTNAGDTANAQNMWGNNSTVVAPTSSQFTVGNFGTVNANGETYVAYLYAHDASSDGIIQCGSYTGTGSDLTVNLGWEPQWWLVKNTTTAGWSWSILDNMRGFSAASDNILQPNSSNAELTTTNISLTPTGVQYASTGNGAFNSSGATYIYIAIRRGPMKTPTLGTSVFTPIAWSGTGSATSVTGTSYPVDMAFVKARNTNSNGPIIVDRLRSVTNTLYSPYNQSESANSYVTGSDIMNGLKVGTDLDTNMSGVTYVYEMFRRAPGFMDEVCYTGNASNRTINHNLGVTPELMIIKSRSAGGTSTYDWVVYAAPTWGTGAGTNNLLKLNSTISASFSNDMLNNTQPTSSVFSLGFYNNVNASGTTYVAYLFASCPGVSKVGSYTGNGSSQTINCGFTTGARFFLVKRTDSTGNWFVWDSARGIVAGNDPYYAMNDTNGDNYLGAGDIVDADNSGIIVNQESTCNINVNAATYIYLAIS